MNTAKLPILIVTENLRVGGAEKYTVLVANELHARGHRVVVLANEGPFRKHFHPAIRFVTARFESGLFGVLFGAWKMIRICMQEGIALIHAQKLESSQAAWLAKFVTGVPIVKTAHGYTPKELTKLGVKIDRYSDKVITVVDWLLPELAANGVREDKLSVIYNGMHRADAHENTALRERLGIHKNDRVVLSTARLERGKNYSALINWFVPVLKRVPNAKLVILGDGPEKKNLVRAADELGLRDSVIFADATTYVQEYLDMADIFCTPTVARGMAVLEAMAAGLPVIGVQPNGAPEVVVDGVTGFVVPAGEGDTYAEKVIYLLENPEIAREFGRAGKARTESIFTLSTMVDSLEAVYASVLS